MGSRNQNSLQSKFDQTSKISKSVFTSNFPDGCNHRDLWKVCNDYGTVVDVFIPNKKSKSGKRFAFVRLIKVSNLERLIENLNTIWIGRFHLIANPVRYERPKAPLYHKGLPGFNGNASVPRQSKVQDSGGLFVNVVNGTANVAASGIVLSAATALVLDDSCIVDHDLSKHAMGKVKDAHSITNLQTILRDEGFSEVNVSYLGGLWVLFECRNVDIKDNLMRHTGMLSWFHVIQDAVHDFVSDERIVWVDIEGIPLNVWSRETFIRIGKKWGETLDIVDNVDASFGRKRLCIKTKQPLSIFESFKVIFKGKVLMVRAKELVTWNPILLPDKEMDYSSDDESEHNSKQGSVHSLNNEEVSNNGSESNVEEDPFKIYDILEKQTFGGAHEVSPSLSHPPGFTPEILVNQTENVKGDDEVPPGVNDTVKNYSQVGNQEANGDSINTSVVNTGGSVLGLLEDMIRVGQAMGYKMDGCAKDLEGNSEGILCVWEASIFKKEYATISDNFVAIYGTWLPNRWNGETVIMGDFNEVRSMDERRGSCFNPSSARAFDHFISSSGLVDVKLEGGVVSESTLLRRMELQCKLYDLNQLNANDSFQKSKVKWAIEGDENSKFFHGMINRKRSHLAIRGVFDKGNWVTDPGVVKQVFCNHFEARFKEPATQRLLLNFPFNKRLSDIQSSDLESNVTRDEIRLAVWSCGENKSPGPDGYSFEFFKKYWKLVGPDLCEAVEYFFETGLFPKGCNSSFIALIPKVADAKLVNDFRPISLVGCVYKVVTKVLANRLSLVIADLVSDTQSAFVANRQILDGPFILNEIFHWCKRKRKQAMFFKVDFAKAYDSVRWDYLLDVLEAFGFGQTWCNWIRGTFSSARASVLVNGSPSNEFSFHCGLKQGDPLSHFLFILIMESLHLSFSRAVNKGIFKGVHLNGSITISHLFYADDAMFIGEWSDANLKGIINVLQCFFLASGLKINIYKSQVLGVGIPSNIVMHAAASLGCGVLLNQFRYLGVMMGKCILTLLKSVLGASPLYYMSIFKVPKVVCRAFMPLIVPSFLNGFGALFLKMGRLVSCGSSFVLGLNIVSYSVTFSSTWCSIVRELRLLSGKGFDFLSFCKRRIGDGKGTRFWLDKWNDDKPLKVVFPRLFSLESDKEILVADKLKLCADHS
ncbi:RNA-directed DNA polymerase, eukaryota [Tanacetum coccineum]